MGRYNMLPKMNKAGAEMGGPNIVPQKYLKREVVKGSLRPVGRFRSPLPTRTNASTLHLFGPGLSSFAAWQVRSTRMRCSSMARTQGMGYGSVSGHAYMPVIARQVLRPVTA